jgi:hypothetical protein
LLFTATIHFVKQLLGLSEIDLQRFQVLQNLVKLHFQHVLDLLFGFLWDILSQSSNLQIHILKLLLIVTELFDLQKRIVNLFLLPLEQVCLLSFQPNHPLSQVALKKLGELLVVLLQWHDLLVQTFKHWIGIYIQGGVLMDLTAVLVGEVHITDLH